MKILNRILMLAICVVAFSIAAMAQNQGNDNKRPEKPPVKIEPPDKNKPRDNPGNNNNNSNRPPKPQSAAIRTSGEESVVA